MSSLKDVALLAGVSPATVSRVINDTRFVDEKTAQRVRDAIRKLNYQPNVHARNLRRKQVNIIGFVVPEVMHDTFASLIAYVDKHAVQNGYEMILGNTNNNPKDEQRVIGNILSMNVAGIIVSRVSDSSRMIDILDRTEVPVVVIDRVLEHEDYDQVSLDNYRAGWLAAETLYARGHRKVGCITGPVRIHLSRERLRGFRDYFASKDLIVEDHAVCHGDFSFESGIQGIGCLFDRKAEFTAVWAQSDLTAIGCLYELNRQGIKVPQDISIMGMDDIKTARMVYPPLTTIRQPLDLMSKTAVEILVRRMKSEKHSPDEVKIEPEIIIRESVLDISGTIHCS